MKRWIHSSTKSGKQVTASAKKNDNQAGYNAAEKFKKKYPKAYEVLGR